ncbi:MAG TPA: hypothetical protein VNF73_02950 [Candidatus Saccharimonadales bacterium]|nr:hypothetical protein [Candidatus Saccharimonadales bacterium]
MKALYVPVTPEVFEALRRLAAREFRHPRQQAARLIVEGLDRDGRRPHRNSSYRDPESEHKKLEADP